MRTSTTLRARRPLQSMHSPLRQSATSKSNGTPSVVPRDAYVERGTVGVVSDPRPWARDDDEMPKLIQFIVLVAVEVTMRLLQLQLERVVKPALKSLREFLSQ